MAKFGEVRGKIQRRIFKRSKDRGVRNPYQCPPTLYS
jgi:hypothetical protein